MTDQSSGDLSPGTAPTPTAPTTTRSGLTPAAPPAQTPSGTLRLRDVSITGSPIWNLCDGIELTGGISYREPAYRLSWSFSTNESAPSDCSSGTLASCCQRVLCLLGVVNRHEVLPWVSLEKAIAWAGRSESPNDQPSTNAAAKAANPIMYRMGEPAVGGGRRQQGRRHVRRHELVCWLGRLPS
jgi:hypothetical protein